MIKALNRFLSAVLLVSLVFLLFSCGGRETVKNGIDISNEKAVFSKETEEKSKAVFYSVLEGAYIAGGVPSVPPKKAEELRALAEDIWEITVAYDISEAQYNEIISAVEKNKEIFVALFTDSSPGVDVFKSVYHSLTSGGGADYAGHTLYDLLLFGMQYKYDRQMERYNKYGYAYLLEEAEEIERQKALLTSEIGPKNFSRATKIFAMGAELFFGGAFEGTAASGFSDREVLVILQRIDIKSLDVSEQGYEFLLSLCVADTVDENSSIADRILHAAGENSDIERLASSLDDVLELFVAAQSSLTDTDAELLKSSEYSALISSVFAKFSDAEWTVFERICATELRYADYENLLLEIYGEDFESYCNSIDAVYTLDELRAEAGKDGFLEKMEGYLAGISPALSYRTFK